MKQTKTSRKAPALPGVGEAMAAAANGAEQKAQAARAEVLNALHDAEEEREAVEDMLAARDAEIEMLQEALDKAQERRQKDVGQVATLRASVAALQRQLDREHGNDMVNAAIRELLAMEQALRAQDKVLEAQREPVHDRHGDRVLLPPAAAEADIEGLYLRMEQLTRAMNELEHLTREPIGPAEIRRRIGEVFAGLGLQVAA